MAYPADFGLVKRPQLHEPIAYNKYLYPSICLSTHPSIHPVGSVSLENPD